MKTFILLAFLFVGVNLQAQQPVKPILDPIEEEVEKDIFIGTYIQESMPYLASCKDLMNNHNESQNCSNKKLLEYLCSNIVYPDSAKLAGIEGTVVISFTITKEGLLDDNSIKILKNIGAGCGEESIRVVKNINENLGLWIPSYFKETAVATRLNFPIKFKLS